jgi:hypothetical protein
MEKLARLYRKELESLHPVELAARLHYRFVLIHPFQDGNGRTARLLANLILLQRGYPPGAIVRAEEHRRQYIDALRAVDVSVPAAELRYDSVELNFFPFIEYLERELLWSLDQALDIVEGRAILTSEDLLRRFLRVEERGVAATGFPVDEKKRQANLAERVTALSTEVEALLRPVVLQANARLAELTIVLERHVGPCTNYMTGRRERAVGGPRVRGFCGLVGLRFAARTDSLLDFAVPRNQFEAIITAEPHQLNVLATRECLIDDRNNTESDPSEWSAHLAVSFDESGWRQEVERFILREVARFLALVESEIERIAARKSGT